MSPLQAGMVYQHLHDESSDLVQHVHRLDGPLVVSALIEAWRGLGRNHGVLRSGFEWDGPEPRQFVVREAPQSIQAHDWRSIAPARQEDRLATLLAEDREQGLRLEVAPPARINLVRLDDEVHLMVWTTHHALLDGTSRSALTGELMRRYEHAVAGTIARIPGGPRYGDFVAWLHEQDTVAAEDFWRDALADVAGRSPLLAGTGTGTGTGTGEWRETLSLAEAAGLRDLCRAGRVTRATVVYAVWALAVARRTGAADVVVATSVSLRSPELPRAEEFVGLLINTIPARVRIDRAAPLIAWFRTIQAELAAQREHGHCGLAQIQRQPGLRGARLFDTLVGVQNYAGSEADTWSAAGVRLRVVRRIGPSGFSLVFRVWPGDADELQLEYERADLDLATVKAMSCGFRELLLRAARNPTDRVAAFLSE